MLFSTIPAYWLVSKVHLLEKNVPVPGFFSFSQPSCWLHCWGFPDKIGIFEHHLVEEFELKWVTFYTGPQWENILWRENCKNQKHRVLGIDLKDISTKFDQSKLGNKNLATRDVLHVKPIVLCLLHVQWRHPMLKFRYEFPHEWLSFYHVSEKKFPGHFSKVCTAGLWAHWAQCKFHVFHVFHIFHPLCNTQKNYNMKRLYSQIICSINLFIPNILNKVPTQF